jgi:hypothetical protein
VLDEKVVQHRLSLFTEIIRLLLAMVTQQRKTGRIGEASASYTVETGGQEIIILGIDTLLKDIPLP